jgi:hypothetical protein
VPNLSSQMIDQDGEVALALLVGPLTMKREMGPVVGVINFFFVLSKKP